MSDVSVTPVVFYGHWACPYANRVEFALAQRGVPYETVVVPPSSFRPQGFALPPEFIEHSPDLEIPMVRVADQYRSDSISVLQFLEALPFPPLLPQAEARSIMDLVGWLDGTLTRTAGGFLFGARADLREAAGRELSAALEEVGRRLSDAGWLVGDGPSLAEAVVVPIYLRLGGLERLGFRAPIDLAVTAHRERIRSLPGWKAVAWTPEQTDEFVNRHLG
jgi:glutathione S-transferase